MPEYVKNLNNVKVGDKFVVRDGYHSKYRIVTCEHVTPKQCKVGGRTYRKEDAKHLGDRNHIWSSPSLYTASDELLATVELERRRDTLARENFNGFSAETINAIYELFRKDEIYVKKQGTQSN